MRTLTASDRSALIKLASSLPAGSPERKAILAGLEPRGLAAVSGKATYVNALDNLANLAELVENAQEIIDGFNLHYASKRVAGMDPRIVSEYQIHTKLTEGQNLANHTIKELEKLVNLFPKDPKYTKAALPYAKALADAQKMLEKLTRQLDTSKKIINTIAKKVAPKKLIEFSKKIEAKIKSRLVDPSQIETFFTQGTDNRNVEAYFVVKVDFYALGIKNRYPVYLWIKEQIAGIPGVSMAIGFPDGMRPFHFNPATVEGAVEMFFEDVEGWENVKGEAESRADRSSTAQSIAYALNRAITDNAKPSPDNRRVDGQYHLDNLPDPFDSGYARRVTEAALAPYKSQIAKTEITREEKGWMLIRVTLK